MLNKKKDFTRITKAREKRAINAYYTTTPRISIWAQENSPVHWRMISSATSGNENDIISVV